MATATGYNVEHLARSVPLVIADLWDPRVVKDALLAVRPDHIHHLAAQAFRAGGEARSVGYLGSWRPTTRERLPKRRQGYLSRWCAPVSWKPDETSSTRRHLV